MTTNTQSTFGLRSWLTAAVPFVLMGGAAALLTVLVALGEVRLAVSASILLVLLGLALMDIRFAIVGLFTYLTFLGDLRRLLTPMVGWSGNDPMILIGPIVTLLLFAGAALSGRMNIGSPIAKVVALFMGFMFLQIFNPVQGGLMVGVAGAMLYLVPMLWFWIGRVYATPDLIHSWLYRIMPVLALFAAAVGLYQVMYGWLPYQLEWYRVAGYGALGPREDLLRSISIFPNLTEYIHYLGITIVSCAAALFKRRWIYLLLIPVLFVAVFLAGSRGPIVKILFVVSLLFTVQGRSVATWAPRLVLTLLLGGAFLVWGLNQAELASSQGLGNERVGHVLGRQADLLPESGSGGTLAIHTNLMWLGIKWGFEQPLGRGIGATTLAAGKYGSGGGSTEKDISDMFLAGGVVGGLLYLVLVLMIATQAVRYWQHERSLVALAIIGLLAFTGLSWLKPGQYVLTPIIWFIIGAMDRFYTASTATDDGDSVPKAS